MCALQTVQQWLQAGDIPQSSSSLLGRWGSSPGRGIYQPCVTAASRVYTWRSSDTLQGMLCVVMLQYGYSDFRTISIRFRRKITISIRFDSRHQLNSGMTTTYRAIKMHGHIQQKIKQYIPSKQLAAVDTRRVTAFRFWLFSYLMTWSNTAVVGLSDWQSLKPTTAVLDHVIK